MNINHFERMNRALATEEQSPHPTHKVGALICGLDQDGQYFERTQHNFWPDPLKKHIGTNKKLGNASTTIHAEMATLFTVPFSQGADIYITDLPCPNCAKTIAQAGIRNVYIDSHTHHTPLGLKIKPYFDQVSMLIFEKAGISVFEMNAPEETITCLLEQCTAPEPTNSIQISRIESEITVDVFTNLVKNCEMPIPFAACIAYDQKENKHFVRAKMDLSIGLSEKDADTIRNIQDKYVPTMQPINRLLVACASQGLSIMPQYIFSSQTPTSREFVNLIGAGHNHLYIGDTSKCRDQWGLDALSKLQEKDIFKNISP